MPMYKATLSNKWQGNTYSATHSQQRTSGASQNSTGGKHITRNKDVHVEEVHDTKPSAINTAHRAHHKVHNWHRTKQLAAQSVHKATACSSTVQRVQGALHNQHITARLSKHASIVARRRNNNEHNAISAKQGAEP